MRQDPSAELASLQASCRLCTRCVEQGLIPEANPTFQGGWGARFFLIGQAPGPVEQGLRLPFMGRAGKELARWMLRAGFPSEERFRQETYIASLMRCFPGRNPKGGDRRPPGRAVENCSEWLERELDLIRPRVLLLVGQMAIDRFLGPGSLQDRVGRRYGESPVIVPLPHPSGQSRWLNDPANRQRLESALEIIGRLREELGPPSD